MVSSVRGGIINNNRELGYGSAACFGSKTFKRVRSPHSLCKCTILIRLKAGRNPLEVDMVVRVHHQESLTWSTIVEFVSVNI